MLVKQIACLFGGYWSDLYGSYLCHGRLDTNSLLTHSHVRRFSAHEEDSLTEQESCQGIILFSFRHCMIRHRVQVDTHMPNYPPDFHSTCNLAINISHDAIDISQSRREGRSQWGMTMQSFSDRKPVMRSQTTPECIVLRISFSTRASVLCAWIGLVCSCAVRYVSLHTWQGW